MKRLILTLALAITMVANVASATTTPTKIDALGPGNRIHGMDISYYQHPGNSNIDSAAMSDCMTMITIPISLSISKHNVNMIFMVWIQ